METEKVPDDRRYTKTHEWVRLEGNVATVGITDHAQGQLTDIVFVELPKDGKPVTSGGSVMVLESVKTVADIYAPANGRVLQGNAGLKAHPEKVNQDPYGDGWLYRMEVEGTLDPATLLDAEGYRAFVRSGG